jgi:hypothetical protein
MEVVMRNRLVFALAVLVLAVLPALAQEKGALSARAGLGTDINLGIAVGGGLGYLMEFPSLPPVDFGFDFYYSHSVANSQEMVGTSLNDYKDTSTLMVYAVSANLLYKYRPGARGFYFITGMGVGAVSVDWIHDSPQDASYRDSGKYTAAGLLVNLGAAYAFGTGLELRLAAPILVFNGPLGSVGFAPMLNLAAAMRF